MSVYAKITKLFFQVSGLSIKIKPRGHLFIDLAA